YLDGMVETLSARIHEVDVNAERRTDALRQEMLAGFQRIDDLFIDIDARLNTIGQRLTRLEVRVGQLEHDLAQLNSRLSAVQTELGALAGRLDEMDSGMRQRFRVLTERVGDLERLP